MCFKTSFVPNDSVSKNLDTYIDEDKYTEFIAEMYEQLLSAMCSMKYS